MTEKTKKISIRRRVRERVIFKTEASVKLVCENCQTEQTFKLAENSIAWEEHSQENQDAKKLPS